MTARRCRYCRGLRYVSSVWCRLHVCDISSKKARSLRWSGLQECAIGNSGVTFVFLLFAFLVQPKQDFSFDILVHYSQRIYVYFVAGFDKYGTQKSESCPLRYE